jgi:hypothetical protein
MIVDKVYILTQQMLDKFSAGGYLPDTEFNNYATMAQNQKLEFDLGQKLTTFNAESLSNFKVNEWLAVVNGVIVNPATFRYFDSARNADPSTGQIIPSAVEELSVSGWDFRLGSALDMPTTAYPAIIQRDGYLEVAPASIQSLNITWIKNPADVVWGYDIVNNRRVYNENNSVDFTYTESDIPDLVYRIIVMTAVEVRDGELIQAITNERAKVEQ